MRPITHLFGEDVAGIDVPARVVAEVNLLGLNAVANNAVLGVHVVHALGVCAL